MSESIKLLVWEKYADMVAEAANIAGVKVDIHVMEEYSYDEIVDALGGGVDAVLIDDWDLKHIVHHNEEKIFSVSGYISPEDGTCFYDEEYEGVFGGTRYSIPCFSEVMVLYIRNGLTEFEVGTWNDFYDSCVESGANNGNYCVLWPSSNLAEVFSFGGGNIDLLRELIHADLVQQFSVDENDVLNCIMSGQTDTVFVIGGLEILKQIQENGYESEWKIAALPESETFPTQVKLNSFSWIVCSNEDEERAAETAEGLVEIFCHNEEVKEYMVENFYVIPDAIWGDGEVETSFGEALQGIIGIREGVAPLIRSEYYTHNNSAMVETIMKRMFSGDLSVAQAFTMLADYLGDIVEPLKTELDHITIYATAEQKKLLVGENLNAGGMYMTAYYMDGSSREIPYSQWQVDGILVEPGENISIKVSYTEDEITKSDDVYVNVYERELDHLEILKYPVKTKYLEGQLFDATGLEVQAYYKNDIKRTIDENKLNIKVKNATGKTHEYWEALTYDDETVVVSFSDHGYSSNTFAIIVIEKELLGLRMKNSPNKIAYLEGECFDPTGMTIEAQYRSWENWEEVPLSNLKFENDGYVSIGSKIFISYVDKGIVKTLEIPIMVKVNDSLTKIYKNLELGEYLQLTSYEIDSDKQMVTDELKIGISNDKIHVIQGVLNIKKLCEDMNISKSAIHVGDLKVDFLGTDGYILQYNIFDQEQNLIDTCAAEEKNGLYLYEVAIRKLIADGELPDSIGFVISSAEDVNATSVFRRDWSRIRIGYVVDVNSFSEPITTADSSKPSNEYGENPKVNLATGRVSYEFFDVSLGNNDYRITLTHQYNSALVQRYENAGFRMGKGWKLNIQQYIYYSGRSVNGNKYTYIDGNGYSHVFARIWSNVSSINADKVYTDEEGQGLTLFYPYSINSVSYYLIKDTEGNCTLFNSNGKIAMMISGPVDWSQNIFDNPRALMFEYSNEKLTRVYDRRLCDAYGNVKSYIEFEYNTAGLLDAMKVKEISSGTEETLKTIEYNYNTIGELISVSKCINNSTKILKKFDYYPYSKLKNIVDADNLTAVRLSYDSECKVGRMIFGYVTNISDLSSFVGQSYNLFTYNDHTVSGELCPNETLVENEKGIIISYNFNRLQEMTCAFEKEYAQTEMLTSLDKFTGKLMSVSMASDTDSTINGNSVLCCHNESAFVVVPEFTPVRAGEEDLKNFMVTCYVRLKEFRDKRIMAIIDYSHDDKECRFYECIDNNAYNVWQKVCVPVSLIEAEVTAIKNVWFGIYDLDGNFVPFDCSVLAWKPNELTEVRLQTENPSIQPKVRDMRQLDVGFYINTNSTKIDMLKNVSVRGKDIYFESIYMTYTDLLETAKSQYSYREKSGHYPVLYGNGMKMALMPVEKGTFIAPGQIEAATIKVDLINQSTNKCNFFIYRKSPDNKTETKIYTELQPEGILTTTEVTTDEKTSAVKLFTSYDGRTLYSEDAYGVRDEYVYDEYLNLLEVKRVHYTANNDVDLEMVVQKNLYDAEKQYLTEGASSYDVAQYVYKKPYDVVTEMKQKEYNFIDDSYADTSVRKLFGYDKYDEKLEHIKLLDGSSVMLKNEITYEQGRFRTISDGSAKYGTQYNIAENQITYTVFEESEEKVIHSRRQAVDAFGNTLYTDVYHRGNETDTVTATVDKYGKMQQLSDGNSMIHYSYADEYFGSREEYPIAEVYDPYEERTYTYLYNYDGELCGWKTSDGDFEIRQISGAETKYTLNGSEKYKTGIVYDIEKAASPRVKQVVNFSGRGENEKDVWSDIGGMSVDYSYDDLGRLAEKHITRYSDDSIFNGTNSTASFTYHYLTNGVRTLPLVSKYVYYGYLYSYQVDFTIITTHRTEIGYTYDEKGNLTSIVENRNSDDEDEYVYNRTTEYAYDAIGRITQETVTEDKFVKVNRNYEYYSSGNGFGRLKKISDRQNSLNTVNYSYNARGQISEYQKGSDSFAYIYDNYGNVLSKRKNGVSEYNCGWTRGNLLKRLTKDGKTIEYDYNHKNIRYKKIIDDKVTKYYLDGSRILGEDREDGKKIRYFYEADGLMGFKADNQFYYYIRDNFNNILGITDELCNVQALYEYGLNGETKVLNPDGTVNTDAEFIGHINPFRWRSNYYDEESGLYNVNGRYYEVERIGYIDALEADMVVENAYELCGLDRNGLLCLNVLLMEAYAATIATSLGLVYDPTYDPEAGQNWFERHIYAVIGGIKILGGLVALVFKPSIGIYLIISGITDIIGGIIGEQLLGAAGQIVLGLQLVIKGAKLLNGCTISGIIDMLLGAGSIAFGSAEAQEAFGAGNWIKDLGINDGWYTGLMLATNVAATAANVIGPKCFAEGTLVACLSADGEEIHKRIEEIKVGDRVLAYDEETGKQGYKPVVRLFRNQTREWYHVFIDGEEIKCTGGHPFYVEGKGFIPAKELKSGDKCLLSTGEDVIIKKVEVEKLAEAETTYNFEVADFHTYYVSEISILCHNICKYYEATRTDRGVIKGQEITKRQALNRVRNGKDVLTNSRSAAKKLAKNAFGNNKVYAEIHDYLINPMKHFHDKNHHIYHIFFN